MSDFPLLTTRFDPEKGPPCHDCTAKCCKYFALEIDRPITPREHDHIRWYLLHEHVAVWVQDKAWFLEIRTRCKHLQPDNQCGIYETRPQICRDHGWPEADDMHPCEYFNEDKTGYDLHFENAEEFDAWSKPELEKREKRLAKRRKKGVLVGAILAAALLLRPAHADTAVEVFKKMGIKVGDVMNSSVLTGRILPGEDKQTVAVVTYLTGKKDEANALGIRLEAYKGEGANLTPIYSRDVAKENGGYVGRGEIALLDLDGDGINEIGVYYDNLKNGLISERRLDIIVREGDTFRVAWTGAVEYDATRAVRDVPQERRDRFLRKVDLANTRRTKGVTLFFTKTVVAVAGERLPQPRQVQETFALRGQQPN
ncbi:MAG TPA: YkgJ family cysteine cluster protein [Candidatus Polarisedimenticolaceae bacterium]|nr:YkgJ family cysteine cluster protein [Candidatus Polarisedimenticolaceae bacterium]